MKRFANLKNTVLKTKENLFRKGMKTLRERGPFVFLAKSAAAVFLIAKRFFREYIPLKFLYIFFKDGKIMKKVQGSRMILDLNDLGISRELALYGVHERNSTAEVKKIIRPGMKILEIGANIGYYALLESKLAGPSGHLYAIEPSPYNFECLKKNIELNGIRNADLYKAAFGEKRSKAIFYLYDRSNLSSFIKREDMGMKAEEIEVEVTTLDDFLRGKTIDFVRMDVEGYELEILKGGAAALSTEYKPKLFFIEVHSALLHKKNSSGREIIESLGRYGYEVVRSFYRGQAKISVDSAEKMLKHPLLENGYWETFFELRK